MNATQAKEWLPLIQALAEGKTLQRVTADLDNSTAKWRDIENLQLDFDTLERINPRYYRIKPEPKKIHLNIAFHKDASGHWYTLVTGNTVADLARAEQNDYFVKWLDHLEYELPEGEV